MAELPETVVEEVVRLTRLARDAVDENEVAAYRRERARLLDEHGYSARVRTDDGRSVLVCYPAEWVTDGVVDTDRIQDVERAVERPLTGAGDPEDWAAIDAHNRDVTAAVEAEHGPVHGANARAFADFMGNHYARQMETAGDRECREFLEEYLPRNAWPSEDQLEAAEESIRLVLEVAGAEPPPTLGRPAPGSERSRPGPDDDR